MNDQTAVPSEVIRLDLTPDEALLLVDHFGAVCLSQQPLNHEARGQGAATDADIALPMRLLAAVRYKGQSVEEYLLSDYNRTGHHLSVKMARVIERLAELGYQPMVTNGCTEAGHARTQGEG